MHTRSDVMELKYRTLVFIGSYNVFLKYPTGVPPSELGMVGYSVAMSHLMSGAYYPRGGPSEIPFQLIPIIERYGGRVMTGARVTKILLDDAGKVNGTTNR